MSYFSFEWPSKWWLVPIVSIVAVIGWASIECLIWMVELIHQVITK